MQSENTAELSAALAKAQGATPAAKLDKTNPHYKSKYASLASIIEAIREPFSANGISYTQTMGVIDGGLFLVTTLFHSSGQWINSAYPLPPAGEPQKFGSALTYGRRYSLSSITGISADEDDDANAAEDGKQGINAAGKTPKPPQKVELNTPRTEDPTTPRRLSVPNNENGTRDWIGFGQNLIAHARGGVASEWLAENKQPVDDMKKEEPKIYDRMMKAIGGDQQEAA